MEKMKKPQEGRYMGFYMDSASPKIYIAEYIMAHILWINR